MLFQFNCLMINCLLTVKKATHKVLTTNNKYYLKLELKGMWSIDNGHCLGQTRPRLRERVTSSSPSSMSLSMSLSMSQLSK